MVRLDVCAVVLRILWRTWRDSFDYIILISCQSTVSIVQTSQSVPVRDASY